MHNVTMNFNGQSGPNYNKNILFLQSNIQKSFVKYFTLNYLVMFFLELSETKKQQNNLNVFFTIY